MVKYSYSVIFPDSRELRIYRSSYLMNSQSAGNGSCSLIQRQNRSKLWQFNLSLMRFALISFLQGLRHISYVIPQP